ncbi:MAG: peptidase MA family metallohydrolase [Polyangiales bacterium]
MNALRRVVRGVFGAPVAAIWLIALFALGAPARADDGPGDVGGSWSGAPVTEFTMPTLPADYDTAKRGDVRWDYPAAAYDETKELMDALPAEWERLSMDLGERVDDRLWIRVVTNPEQMRALAPVGMPPPPYAVGVAYPRLGVILLSLTAPDTWERPSMRTLLVHELSHVALQRAVRGHDVPRWFSEGVAIEQAKEFSLERYQTLLRATFARTLIPLRKLSSHFPTRPNDVNVAYAESASFVHHLRREPYDARHFRELIEHLADGAPFERAIEKSYGANLNTLEREWLAEVRSQFGAWPMVVGGGVLWALVTLLLGLAYVKLRRKHHTKLRQWGDEEAAARESELAQERFFAAGERADGASSAARRTVGEDDPPPRATPELLRERRDSSVPTVEHDGERHTLH